MVRAIGDKPGSAPRRERVFTPTEATAMLPLVSHIAAELYQLSRSIETQRSQIREIDRIPGTIQIAEYRDELRDIRSSLDTDETRLHQCVAELAALGVVPHSPIDGGVDFPGQLNRRSIQFCWLPGEKEVGFWHEIDESCELRKSIDEAK